MPQHQQRGSYCSATRACPTAPSATARQASGSDSIANTMSELPTTSAGLAPTCNASSGGEGNAGEEEQRFWGGLGCKPDLQILAGKSPVQTRKQFKLFATAPHLGARLLERLALVAAAVPHGDLIPRLDQVVSHRQAHDANSKEPDLGLAGLSSGEGRRCSGGCGSSAHRPLRAPCLPQHRARGCNAGVRKRQGIQSGKKRAGWHGSARELAATNP